MEVSGQHHAPAFLTAVKKPVPIEVGARWAPGKSRICLETKIPPTRIRTPVHPARSLVTIQRKYRLQQTAQLVQYSEHRTLRLFQRSQRQTS